MNHLGKMIFGLACKIGLVLCPGVVLILCGYGALDRMIFWERYYDQFKLFRRERVSGRKRAEACREAS